MTKEIANIVTNAEVIAINQDRLGRAGNMISRALDGSYEIWGKAIYSGNIRQNGDANNLSELSPAPCHAVVFLNRLNTALNITLNFDDLFNNNLSTKPPIPNCTVFIREHLDRSQRARAWCSNGDCFAE